MNFSMNIILKILNKTPQMKMIIEATKNNKRVNDLVNIIIKQIERYPYIKKHPIIFFRSFFEVTYLAIKYNLECMPNLLKDIDEKIKDNKKLSTDEYIDFIEIIIKKYELEEKIIEVCIWQVKNTTFGSEKYNTCQIYVLFCCRFIDSLSL